MPLTQSEVAPADIRGLSVVKVPRSFAESPSCCKGKCSRCGAGLTRPDSLSIGVCAHCAVECSQCHRPSLRLTANKICDPCEIAEYETWIAETRVKIKGMKLSYRNALNASLAAAGLKAPAPKRIRKPKPKTTRQRKGKGRK